MKGYWKELKELELIFKLNNSTNFECKYQNTTIIQFYARTKIAEEEGKEDFFLYLQIDLDKWKARDLILVIGDISTKVSSDSRNW